MRLDVISKDMEYCLNLKIPISSCRKEACRVIFLNSWLPSGCFFWVFRCGESREHEEKISNIDIS